MSFLREVELEKEFGPSIVFREALGDSRKDMSTGSRVEEYDLVTLGGGTGGTVAAWTFAGQGQQSRAFTFGESETTSRYCCQPPPKASYN